MALLTRYQRALQRQLGLLGTWPPGAALELGDVGTLEDGVFRKETTLRELGIPFEAAAPREMGDLQLTEGANVQLAPLTSPGTLHQARVQVELEEAGSFLLHTHDGAVHQIAQSAALSASLLGAYQDGRWQKRWCVVERVVLVRSVTLLLAGEDNVSIEIVASRASSASFPNLADPELVLQVVSQRGALESVIVRQGLTPLFQVARIKVSLLGRPELTPWAADEPSREEERAAGEPGFRFYVGNELPTDAALPAVLLRHQGQDQLRAEATGEVWTKVSFSAVLFDADGVKELGLLGVYGRDVRALIGEGFERLGLGLYTVGERGYYPALADRPERAARILDALHDLPTAPANSEEFGAIERLLFPREAEYFAQIRRMLAPLLYGEEPEPAAGSPRPGWLFQYPEHVSRFPDADRGGARRVWCGARPLYRRMKAGDRAWLAQEGRIFARGVVGVPLLDLQRPDDRARFQALGGSPELERSFRFAASIDVTELSPDGLLSADQIEREGGLDAPSLLSGWPGSLTRVEPEDAERLEELLARAGGEGTAPAFTQEEPTDPLPDPPFDPSLQSSASLSPEPPPSDPAPFVPPPDPEPPALAPETLTLVIRGGHRALYRGLALDEKARGTPIWEVGSESEPLGLGEEPFRDGDAPCGLEQALRQLPTAWDRAKVEVFGDDLARLLFGGGAPPEVAAALAAGAPGQSLRLALDLDAAAAAVPWEYLRIKGRFLVEGRVSIVRHVRTRATPHSVVLDPRPKRLLFASANPDSLTESRYEEGAHSRLILDALQGLGIVVDPLPRCDVAGLRRRLHPATGAEGFHFLGHGRAVTTRREPRLVLHRSADGLKARAAGDAAPEREDVELPSTDLTNLIERSAVRFVFLGACHGARVAPGNPLVGMAWEIVADTGRPVVAMQMAVPQEFATTFAGEFYGRLGARGYDLELAVYDSRTIEHQGRHAFGIPALYADLRAPTPERGALPERPPGWEARFVALQPLLVARPEAAQRWAESPAVPPAVRRAVERSLAEEDERGAGEGPAPPPELPPPPEAGEPWGPRLDLLASLLRPGPARERLRGLGESLGEPPPPPRPALEAGLRPEVLLDPPLGRLADAAAIDAAAAEIQAKYSFPPALLYRIVGELQAGRHVLLTGPVGTGKTTLAREVAARIFGFEALVETASADWTRFEVIGGFWPQPTAEGQLRFAFRPGAFLEAVLANWEVTRGRDTAQYRRIPRGERRGAWLVLDELNRADMDRAMGGLFTALETRRLRIPAAGAAEDAPSTEVPIPADFRVIATINAADRHYLFRLSDALKRRFAFVHVPVTPDWHAEWHRLRAAAAENAPEGWLTGDDAAQADLRRFVYLVRAIHPLGSALALGALRFLAASGGLVQQDDGWRLHQAISGSILPNLEDLPGVSLRALLQWARSADAGLLADALREALPDGDGAELRRSFEGVPALALHAQPQSVVSSWDDAAPDPRAALAAWVASRVVRQGGALPLLAGALGDMVANAAG